jgi:hypothetical protein
MPQHDLDLANGSGAAFRSDANGALVALGSTMKGPGAPPAPIAGMMWLEDDNPSSTVWTLRQFDGTDWITLGVLDTVGNAFSPAAAAVGFVNLLDNAGGQVNQRAYVSGTAVGAANTYTLDRWRVVTSGQALSWTDSAGVRTMTAPAGGIEQVIEGARVAADFYTLTWTGTAAATINGSAVANGAGLSLSGGVNVTVRFSNGTVATPQLQRGRIGLPFEWRHPAVERLLCARYFQRIENFVLYRTSASGVFNGGVAVIPFAAPMRATPTVTRSNIGGDYDDPSFAMTPNGGCAFFATGTTVGQWFQYTLFLNAEF